MNYVSKSTPELVLGDVVDCHGLRCLIDREPQVSHCHPNTEHSPTVFTKALVLNREENDFVPCGWTLEPDGTHRWMIQGNKLARWAVEEEGA